MDEYNNPSRWTAWDTFMAALIFTPALVIAFIDDLVARIRRKR